MAVTTNKAKTEGVTWRRYKDGESEKDFRSSQAKIFQASWTHKCPEYVLSTPPHVMPAGGGNLEGTLGEKNWDRRLGAGPRGPPSDE